MGVRPLFAAVRVERFPHEPIAEDRNGADAAGRQSDIVCQVKDEPIQFRNASPKHAAAWGVMEETSTHRPSTEPM